MHHHVFSPGLDVVALQQEGVFPEAHFRKSLSEPIGFESDSLVETQTCFEFLCGKEWTERANLASKINDRVHL
jgi:hypothetical protein